MIGKFLVLDSNRVKRVLEAQAIALGGFNIPKNTELSADCHPLTDLSSFLQTAQSDLPKSLGDYPSF